MKAFAKKLYYAARADAAKCGSFFQLGEHSSMSALRPLPKAE
jgi:hypothetical protein